MWVVDTVQYCIDIYLFIHQLAQNWRYHYIRMFGLTPERPWEVLKQGTAKATTNYTPSDVCANAAVQVPTLLWLALWSSEAERKNRKRQILHDMRRRSTEIIRHSIQTVDKREAFWQLAM